MLQETKTMSSNSDAWFRWRVHSEMIYPIKICLYVLILCFEPLSLFAASLNQVHQDGWNICITDVCVKILAFDNMDILQYGSE